MKATSAAEYKKARYKAVELPSLLTDGSHPVFIIRKPPPKIYVKLLEMFNVQVTIDSDPEEIERALTGQAMREDIKAKLPQFLEILLPACVVEPRVTTDPNDKEALHIDDIDSKDQFALLEAILDFAGLSERAEEERNLLREAS